MKVASVFLVCLLFGIAGWWCSTWLIVHFTGWSYQNVLIGELVAGEIVLNATKSTIRIMYK